MTVSISVLITDDNPIVRTALRAILTAEEGIEVVGEAGNGVLALEIARRSAPTVTLLDYRMPIADGLDVVADLTAYTSVIALTSDDSRPVISAMLRGGASGYLVHGQFDPPELVRAIRAVAAGQGWLSPTAASLATAALRAAGDHGRLEFARAEYARRTGLTAREREILSLLCEGLSNGVIATRLGLTEKTVKNHLSSVFAKLQVTSRTEAIVRWSTPA